MASIDRVLLLRSELEARLLRISLYATLAIAGLGILFGFLAQSTAILFDGVFSLVDVAITWLTLVVARLVASEGNHRFQNGFWHLEPLVMALKSSVLIFLVGYALLSSVNSLLKGGYDPEFGIALVYAGCVALIAFGMWWWLKGQADRIDSGLVQLDVKAWLMSALITLALFLAFIAALAMEGTAAEHLIPYVDPAVLAFLSLLLLPLPFREARQSLQEILLISPSDLDAQVCGVMADFVARHGFRGYRSYVSKAGRARFIEVGVLLPAELRLAIGELDAFRAEIGAAIGGEGPDRWLTIQFTADPRHL